MRFEKQAFFHPFLFFFFPLFSWFMLWLMRELVRRCGCQCIGCIWIKVRILIISPGLGFASSPLSLSLFLSREPRNVIAVVFYIISSRRVGAIADSRRGSFCFNLLIPKSGSFLSAVVYTKASLIGGEFASFFLSFSTPLSLSLSLSCKLLLSFTSNCLRSLSDEWIHNSTLSSMDLYATERARRPVIIQTNTPRPRLVRVCAAARTNWTDVC